MRCIRIALTVIAAAGLLAAADPMLGTFRLNTAKSKFSPGPGPKAMTLTYSQEGEWYTVKAEGMAHDGTAITRGGRFRTDGKEYEIDGPYGRGMITVQRSDEYHATSTTKLEGGGTVVSHTVMSKDGRTRTVTTSGTNAKGEQLNSTYVYERQ